MKTTEKLRKDAYNEGESVFEVIKCILSRKNATHIKKVEEKTNIM